MRLLRRHRAAENTLYPGSRSVVSGQRYYNPKDGRFLGRDPIEETGGLNLYGFCGNNAINRWDYLGMKMVLGYIPNAETGYDEGWYDDGTPDNEVYGRDPKNGMLVVGGDPFVMDPFKVVSPVQYTYHGDFVTAYDPETGQGWVAVPEKGLQDMTGAVFDVATLGMAAGAILSAKVAGGATEMATTSLYRAVMPAELASIQSAKAFANPVGIEVKYFSTSAEGAAAYARQAATGFGDGPFTIIKTEIPTNLITPEMRVIVDRGVETIVVPTETLLELARPVVFPATPIPPSPGVVIVPLGGG